MSLLATIVDVKKDIIAGGNNICHGCVTVVEGYHNDIMFATVKKSQLTLIRAVREIVERNEHIDQVSDIEANRNVPHFNTVEGFSFIARCEDGSSFAVVTTPCYCGKYDLNECGTMFSFIEINDFD